jgi:AcrR family transcriptional regulator
MIEKKKRRYNSQKREQGAEQTRLRVLEAARSLLLEESYPDISVDQIAEKSGVARATIYLQFGSKLGVLQALVEYIDAIGLKDLFGAMDSAANSVEALHKSIPPALAFSHRYARLLRTFRAQAVSDTDFRTVLQERLQQRRQNIGRLVEWLHREGKLAEGWSVNDATDYLSAIGGFPIYDELVNEQGWTLEQLSRRTLDTIDRVLLVN